MRDPLFGFDWASLYDNYDDACKKYDSSSRCLDRFDRDRPATDRDLYYRLIDCYAPSARVLDRDPIGTYQSLLYWKLYSTGGPKGTNILTWLAAGSDGRRAAESHLPELLSGFPPSLSRDARRIVRMVRELPQIPGMGSGNECRLPVRTTFLHFLYPSTVPIFDKMVLQAVGVEDEKANQDITVLESYLPFVWGLADRYLAQSSIYNREEPLRRIDMALWVKRASR